VQRPEMFLDGTEDLWRDGNQAMNQLSTYSRYSA